jgi:chaperonin GroES
MKPLHDLLLIKPCASDEVTEGGLYIPESARERSNKGEVIEVGIGTKLRPVEAKKGDIIIHIKGAGEEYVINGEKHYLIRQADVLSYVTNN